MNPWTMDGPELEKVGSGLRLILCRSRDSNHDHITHSISLASHTMSSASKTSSSPAEMTKNQRENATRAARKKAEKAAFDTEQTERLRRHKRELEEVRIKEFYKNAPGKAAESRWKQ